MKNLQTRLKQAREDRGLSQKELARKSKCVQSAIGNVESGERKTLRNLVLVARALNVSADWLFDGTGPEPQWNDAPYQPLAHGLTLPQHNQHAVHDIASAGIWPFSRTRAQFDALPPQAQALINTYMQGVCDANTPTVQKKTHQR